MLAASGFLAWAFYQGEPNTKAWNFVLAGIAARTLVRQIASAKFTHSEIKLGEPDIVNLHEIPSDAPCHLVARGFAYPIAFGPLYPTRVAHTML